MFVHSDWDQKDGTITRTHISAKRYMVMKTMNAIQKNNSIRSMCAVVQAYAEGKLTGKGFQKQEDVPLETFLRQ